MKSRVLVAVAGIPLLLVIVLLLPPIVIPFAISLLSALAVYELLWDTGYAKRRGLLAAATVLSVFIPFWCYFGCNLVAGMAAVMLFMLGVTIAAMASGQKIQLGQMSAALYAGFLIPMMLSAFVLLRAMPNAKFLILLPFITSFGSDSFALFAGMAFGKHKLAPVLSPKKTIEGSVGGFVGSVALSVLYGVILSRFVGAQVNYFALVLFGLLGSAFSQIGDLSFSYIKREFAIKDYSNLIPGHGGILDRFDSIIFSAPLTFVLVSVLPFFQF